MKVIPQFGDGSVELFKKELCYRHERGNQISKLILQALMPLLAMMTKHAEHSSLEKGSILDAAFDPVSSRRTGSPAANNSAAALPCENQHRIDHMLQNARSGDAALLGDVSDQKHRG